MRTFATRILLTGILLSAAGEAQAACVRHIYNNSNQLWSFFADTDTNVYFNGAVMQDGATKCFQGVNGTCWIAPHTTVEITYGTGNGEAVGDMVIGDAKGENRRFHFMGQWQCPYIRHSGNTGAVAMNDPANGDFNIWGPDTWQAGD